MQVYPYTKNGHFCDFITTYGLHYRVGIYNGSHLLRGLPFSNHIFYLEFILLTGIKPGNDPAVMNTICAILESRLNQATDILVYNEFTADSKGPARHRFFRKLIQQYTGGKCIIHETDPYGLGPATVVYAEQNIYSDTIETYFRLLSKPRPVFFLNR